MSSHCRWQASEQEARPHAAQIAAFLLSSLPQIHLMPRKSTFITLPMLKSRRTPVPSYCHVPTTCQDAYILQCSAAIDGHLSIHGRDPLSSSGSGPSRRASLEHFCCACGCCRVGAIGIWWTNYLIFSSFIIYHHHLFLDLDVKIMKWFIDKGEVSED